MKFTSHSVGATVAGKPVDVWACGVTLYSLVFGRVPFTAENLLDIYEAIRNDPLQFPPQIPIPDDLKDLLTQMLDKNPCTRIKIPVIKVRLVLNSCVKSLIFI